MRWTQAVMFSIIVAPLSAGAVEWSGYTGMPITIVGPSEIFCTQPQGSSCVPLNAAACSLSTTLGPLEATLSKPTISGLAGYPSGSKLLVWIEQVGDSRTTNVPTCRLGSPAESSQQKLSNAELPFATDRWPVDPNTTTLAFPADIETETGNTITLAAEDFLKGTHDASGTALGNACTTEKELTYALCFGVDYTSTQGIAGADGQITPSYEPTAWIRIVVDTKPPTGPTGATAEGLDARLQVHPTASTEAGDSWVIRVRPLAAGVTPSDSACLDASWNTVTKHYYDAINVTTPIVSGLTNGTEYEGCVALADVAGNVSTAWKSFTATPTNQCDFVECYPNELETGYCAGLGPTPLAAIAALLLLRRARRKEVRS